MIRQAVLGGEALELGLACHALFVLGHDLAQQARPGSTPPCGQGRQSLRCGRHALAPRPGDIASGRTWPGRARSAGLVSGSMSDLIVAALSPAEMPVVVP